MQKKYGLIVFDLDGTLIESHSTIYNATIRSFDDLKINHTLNEEKFLQYIGYHFVDIFQAMKINVPSFEDFIGIYKTRYFDYIDHSVFYPNVTDMLNYLDYEGFKIGLLTTKGQEQADKICKHFKIDGYFDYIMGRRPGVEHKPSGEPLQIICDALGVKPEDTLMVGDTEMDIGCGHNAGADTCAVTYGYRTFERIKQEKPTYIIDDISELKNIVVNK